MRNRLIYAAVGLVGVLLIGLAVASATVWRADPVLRATARADQAIVVTEPGVLEMAGDPVTVTATVPAGDHVVLAVGRDTDVQGWVGTDPHQSVSGLAGWHSLALAAPAVTPLPSGSATPAATAPATASAAATAPASPQPSPTTSAAAAAGPSAGSASPVPDAASSDMWVTSAQGAGSASLTWQAQPGRWSLLVVGSTASGAGVPPALSFAWPRTVTTPYLVPGTVAGGLLLLVALYLFWRDLRRRPDAGWTAVATGAIPLVTAGSESGMTRRQLREMAELARTGQLPLVGSPAGAAPSEAVPTGVAAAVAEPAEAVAEPAAAVASGQPSQPTAQVPAHPAPSDETAVPPAHRVPRPVPGSDEPSAPSAHGDARSATASDEATGPDVTAVPAPDQAGRRLGWRRAAGPGPAPTSPAGPALPPTPQLAAWTPRAADEAVRPGSRPAAPGRPTGEPDRPAPHAAAPGRSPDEQAHARSGPDAPHRSAHEQARPGSGQAAPDRSPMPGGRRARRQAAEAGTTGSIEVVAPGPGSAEPTPSQPPTAPARSSGAVPAPGVSADPATRSGRRALRPAWMPASPVTAPVPPAVPGAAPTATAADARPVLPAASPGSAAPRTGPAPAAGSRPTRTGSGAHQASAMPAGPRVPSAAAAAAPPTGAPAATPTSSTHGGGTQPAWLSRVAARWEQEDAAAEAGETAGPRPSSPALDSPRPATAAQGEPPAPADTQPGEPSRADAWRRAWGLPPLENPEEDR